MRVHEQMIESELAACRRDEIRVLPEGLDVLVPDGSWIDLQFLIGLQALEAFRTVESEIDLLIIENLQTQNILPLMPESGQSRLDLFRFDQKVRQEHEDGSVGYPSKNLIGRLDQIGSVVDGAAVQLGDDSSPLALTTRTIDHLVDSVGEHEESDSIGLLK